MKKLFVLAIATGLFVACNNSSSQSNDSTAVTGGDSTSLNAAPAPDSLATPAGDSTAVVGDSTAVAPAADSAHKH